MSLGYARDTAYSRTVFISQNVSTEGLRFRLVDAKGEVRALLTPQRRLPHERMTCVHAGEQTAWVHLLRHEIAASL